MSKSTKERLRQERRVTGGGPWLFEPGELAPGEKYVLDLPNMKYNNTKGWFRKWLPIDQATVTNMDSANAVVMTINGQYQNYCTPNTVESFNGPGITRLNVRNDGTTPIADGNLKIELTKEPYNADDKAREESQSPWLQRALNDIIPGGIPGRR